MQNGDAGDYGTEGTNSITPSPMASLNNNAIVIWDNVRASVINVVGDVSWFVAMTYVAR